MYLIMDDDNAQILGIVTHIDDVDYFMDAYCEENNLDELNCFVEKFNRNVDGHYEPQEHIMIVNYINGRIFWR